MFAFKPKKIVGLDTDETSCLASELTTKGKSILLVKSALAPDLKQLFQTPTLKGVSTVISLPAQVVLFRSFQVASSFLTARDRQKNILAFLARQNLPFKLEECYWDTFITNGMLNFIAVKKEVAQRYIAQAKEASFNVLGLTASLIALYNVIIYNYPEQEKGRFAVLNIRSTTSELLISEARRLWSYPLAVGSKGISADAQAAERFSQEVQNVLNSHYLHNPVSPVTQKSLPVFYYSGQGISEALESALKNIFTPTPESPVLQSGDEWVSGSEFRPPETSVGTDTEKTPRDLSQGVFTNFTVTVLDPLKRIAASPPVVNKEAFALSLGLALSYFNPPGTIGINLIKAKVREEQIILQRQVVKRALFGALLVGIGLLLAWDLKLGFNLNRQVAFYKNAQFQVSSVLPKVKILQQEKEILQGQRQGLEKEIYLQGLYLRALAAVAEARPKEITLNSFEAQTEDAIVKVALAGKAGQYEQINAMLSALRKHEFIKQAKVVTSALAAAEAKENEIDFKIFFNIG